MIEVRELTKRYGSTVAVDDLTFKVREGEVTGFLGPNGASKSTTMRVAQRTVDDVVGRGSIGHVQVAAAKVVTFVVVVVTVGLAASFSAFGIGQAVLSGKHIGASLDDPGILRAVVGGGLYLAAVGALGLGLGTILRRTAGAIAALVGLLLVVPLVSTFQPAAWNDHLSRYLPTQAGTAVFRVVPDATSLSPWTGFAVLVGYAAVALAVGAVLLTRRDA